MPHDERIPRLRFDLPTHKETGRASVLIYEVPDGLTLVVTTEHNGDPEVFLSKAEFVQLQEKIAEIQ